MEVRESKGQQRGRKGKLVKKNARGGGRKDEGENKAGGEMEQ
jgi:hypothetical protein